MEFAISQRIAQLEPSATLAMAAKARERKAAGLKVLDFTLGEPDFNTPDHICQAALEAMKAGHTHYTPAAGIPELRTAIAKAYAARHGIEYASSQVVVSNGAKHSLHNALSVILNPGDEVIIPAPYWVSYAELVKLAGGNPIILETKESEDFKLSPAQFKSAITAKTKAMLFCSPSNPTGTTYTGDELAALGEVASAHDLLVISDEIYERLVYDGLKFTSFPAAAKDMKDRTILVNGVSKAYAMTGWRMGWTIAPAKISAAIADLQSQETSNPSSISQYAALAALNGPQECVESMRQEFAKRREFVLERANNIQGVRCPKMAGAFYAFMNIEPLLGKRYDGAIISGSSDWCLKLLEARGVATVMGSAFGAEGYVRMSFATDLETLRAGFDAIEAFAQSAI